MPQVGGKSYDYDTQGLKAAFVESMRSGKPMEGRQHTPKALETQRERIAGIEKRLEAARLKAALKTRGPGAPRAPRQPMQEPPAPKLSLARSPQPPPNMPPPPPPAPPSYARR